MSWVMVGVAAAGLIKSEMVDRPKEERQRKLAAKTQALSPWTGLTANPIQEADPIGTTMQYGMAGAGMKQNLEDHDQVKRLTDSEISKNNAVASGITGKPMPAAADMEKGSVFQNDTYQGQSGLYGNQRKSPWMIYSV